MLVMATFDCYMDEHNGHVLYTGSSVMDTIDMCYPCHLLSLVILSLHLYNHAIVYLGFINIQSVLCTLVLLPYSMAIFCFCLLLFSKEYFLQPITTAGKLLTPSEESRHPGKGRKESYLLAVKKVDIQEKEGMVYN